MTMSVRYIYKNKKNVKAPQAKKIGNEKYIFK